MSNEFLVSLGVLTVFNPFGRWTKAGERPEHDLTLKTWASQASLTYRADGYSIEREPFAALPLFHEGSNQRITNLVAGVWRGLDIRFFDLSYRPNQKNREPVVQTVVVIRTPGLSLTEFSLQMRHWLSFIDARDSTTVDFPDDPTFSETYLLRAVDHDAVREHFRGAVRTHLTRDPGWHLEGVGEWIVCWRPGHRCSPSGLPAFIEQTRAFREMLSGGRPSASGGSALSEGDGESG